MAYQDTVQSRIRPATTSVDASNLENSMIIDANNYFPERIVNFSSMTEVNASSIDKNGKVYGALQHAFSQPNGKTPIYVGRRLVDDTTLTPVVADNTTYGFTLQTLDTDTNDLSVTWDVEFTSGVSATDAEITAGLDAAITALTIPTSELSATDNIGTLTITPAANREVIVTKLEDLTQEFTVTETASDCYTEITNEDNSSFYYVCTTQRDQTFVIELAQQVAATTTSNMPKLFRVSDNDIKTLSAQTDPSDAEDLIGILEDMEIARCSTEWHDQSEVLFPELAATVYNGSFFPGTQTFKFMQNNTTPAARHPVQGRLLTTQEIGFILDRNSSVAVKERGVTFYHGGQLSQGSTSWIDNQIITDWINDTIEVRVLNVLLNQSNAGLPLTFTSSDLLLISGTIDDVLYEAVQRKMLSGFEPSKVPTTISFEDQANRILQDVSWVGYLAGKIHMVIIDGVLTYNTDTTGGVS